MSQSNCKKHEFEKKPGDKLINIKNDKHELSLDGLHKSILNSSLCQKFLETAKVSNYVFTEKAFKQCLLEEIARVVEKNNS